MHEQAVYLLYSMCMRGWKRRCHHAKPCTRAEATPAVQGQSNKQHIRDEKFMPDALHRLFDMYAAR